MNEYKYMLECNMQDYENDNELVIFLVEVYKILYVM